MDTALLQHIGRFGQQVESHEWKEVGRCGRTGAKATFPLGGTTEGVQ